MGSFLSKSAQPSIKEQPDPQPTVAQHLHIAIVGAGLGGIALAIALSRNGIPYTIYESAAAYATVGAGVGIGPNALRAMDSIDERFRAEFEKVCIGNLTTGKEHVMMEAAMIEDGLGEKQGWKSTPWGSKTYRRTAAHRKDLLDIMTSLTPEGSVKFNKRVKGIVESENGVELSFEDGDTANVSCVIGCDGVKGFTRGYVLKSHPEEIKPVYAQQYAYRAVLPIDKCREILGDLANDARMYFGKDVNLSTYVISHGREVNVVGFVRDPLPWKPAGQVTRETSREQMLADFTKHDVDRRMIKLLEWAKPMQWGMFHQARTSTYRKNLVCLLGDSAHASLPNQASGAGQGLEDALIMSRVLEKAYATLPKSATLPETKRALYAAFEAYDDIRRPRAQHQVDTSVECGLLYNLSHPEAGDDMQKTVDNLNQRFDWLWNHDLDQDAEKAVRRFGRIVGSQI